MYDSYLHTTHSDSASAKLFIDTKYERVSPLMAALRCTVRCLIWANFRSQFESLMSFKWHVVNKVKISTTFNNLFVVSKQFYENISVYLVIHDENRKSVENDVCMFIAILYRILPSDLSWVLLERFTNVIEAPLLRSLRAWRAPDESVDIVTSTESNDQINSSVMGMTSTWL